MPTHTQKERKQLSAFNYGKANENILTTFNSKFIKFLFEWIEWVEQQRRILIFAIFDELERLT